MIAFTHEELLQLRWLVFDASGTLEPDKRAFLLLKLDKMIADDGQRLIMHNAACLKH